jgi:hypothetical protein
MPDAQKKIADYVFRRSQATEEPAALSIILPTYPSAPPPEDYAAIPTYPAYPPVYAFPDYSPLFVAPFIGIVVGPRFFFHGHPDFHHPDFQYLDFLQTGIHTLPPLTHVGGGLGRVAAPSFAAPVARCQRRAGAFEAVVNRYRNPTGQRQNMASRPALKP